MLLFVSGTSCADKVILNVNGQLNTAIVIKMKYIDVHVVISQLFKYTKIYT